MENYEDFQELEASEKEGLVVLEASTRLMGWSIHSGSIYKLEDLEFNVFSDLTPIQQAGAALSEVASIAAIVAGSYFHDRDNATIYLRTSDSVNPNARFVTLTFQIFFAKAGRNLPHDLGTGFEVHWRGTLESTSEFGVETDNQNQLGIAIEGKGTISLKNDQEFWQPLFDKVYFENQRIFVYSWSPILPITEAKLIYRGRVQGKSYTPDIVSFTLADLLNELRAPVALQYVSDYAGARVPDSNRFARQRKLYGYLYGHRPINIDEVLDGYPLTGTQSLTQGGTAVTGSGTQFLTQLSPGDQVLLAGDTERVTVDEVLTDSSYTVTEAYTGQTKAAVAATVDPSHPKRYANRVFLVADHPLCEPTTTVAAVTSTAQLTLTSTRDLLPDDEITIDGEITSIRRVSGARIRLNTSLSDLPPIGAPVTRPAISAVYLNARQLVLDRDYTYSAEDATITLEPLAEFNIAPVRAVTGTVDFTNASRDVTGAGTRFSSQLKTGDWIRGAGQGVFFEILDVVDDANLVLRAAASYTQSTAALFKSPDVYKEGSSKLSCDCLGATDTGLTTGALLKTAPEIVEQILIDGGLSSIMNTASFDQVKQLTKKRLGLAIPKAYRDQKAPKLRDVIDEINRSDFCSLVQNEDFDLEYQILSPERPTTLTRLKEFDVLSFAVESNSERIVKTSRVGYGFQELDHLSGDSVNLEATRDSDVAQYLARSTKEFSIDTLLIDESDAQIYANRWAFIFEVASSVLKIQTKLQAARLQIGDCVELSHPKLYERIGSSATRKVGAIQAVKKGISDGRIELDDLANAFSRCGIITENDAPAYADSSEQERILNGFITDPYGMIDNNPATHGVNLIW